MITVYEQTTSVLTLTFTDEKKAAVVPTSGRYRIDDALSGTNIKDWTSFTPSLSTYDITISNVDNRLLDTSNDTEQRKVTITVNYGSGKLITSEYAYEIKNLGYFPPMLTVVGSGGAVAGGAATIA